VTKDREFLSPIEEIVEDARNGRIFILVDDEGRENEGDLVIPAQMATPAAINFMATHGRGLICLALTRDRVDQLGLPLMTRHNESRHETAFTVSIEAKEGISTGISVADRARTIAVAIDPTKGRRDLGSPGHVFPLVARGGGTLMRAGHTEAAVDIARLAGLTPAGVICEIMNEDGTMARLPDLVAFAQRHGLKIATIADLIAYRLRYERVVRRADETVFNSVHGGEFRMVSYTATTGEGEHLALVKGDIAGPGPVLVRVHALDLLDDVLGDRLGGRAGELHGAMRMIAEAGRGVVVLIRGATSKSLTDRARERLGKTTEGEAGGTDLREIGIGAQILLDLGIRDLVLMSNSRHTYVGLDGYGITVSEQRPIPGDQDD